MTNDNKGSRARWFKALVSSTVLKNILSGGIGFSFLLQSSIVQAQISVDPHAGAGNRPDIGTAPNGVPSIDIVTPNSKGLSHNKYHDFNIDHPGVIWNNHTQEVGKSQLGGIMPGNPHLRFSGAARVILNEVTSGKRSALKGPGEVFGHAADVIIANPNGISCEGCGFINTPHATLTTGVPEIDETGFLKGFEVKGGDITFGKSGANFFTGKGSVDILDIVSRTVHFEGPVAGREIGVHAGTGHFDYVSREMKELTDITGKPEYAIDGSALGALQADRIKLVATEKGVGVRMRHDMAANAGQLRLSADGKISLKNVFGHGGVLLKSKSDHLHAKRITSKKNIEIAAKKDVMLETVGADGHVTAEAQEGLLTIAGQATSGGNMKLFSRHAIKVSGLGSGADMALATGGNLTIDGIVLAGGSLKAHAGGAIQAHLLAGGVDMAKTGAAGVVVLGAQGGVDLQSRQGTIEVESVYGAGDIALVSHDRISVSQTFLSHQNVAIHAGSATNADIHFGQLIAYGKAHIEGGGVDFASLLTGDDADLRVGSLHAGTLMTGVDFAQSSVNGANVNGEIILHDKGSLSLTIQEGVKVGQTVSGENIDIFAGNDIYYDQVMSYGTVKLTSVSGEISVENALSARGDVKLKANTLDLRDNRSHIITPQTLFLDADNLYVSGSSLIYGGLDFKSANALEIRDASLEANADKGGTGDILLIAPSLMADKEASVLAARDLVIKTNRLENRGQLASGRDLTFNVTADVTNSRTGLIYAGGNGALRVDGSVLNDFGAIISGHDLFFTNAAGTGRNFSLVNKAGFIQAGGTLAIQTKTLQNEADSTPVLTESTRDRNISFQKPKGSNQLRDGMLYNDENTGLWGSGHEHQSNTVGIKGHVKLYLDYPLWNSQEETYGTAISSNGTVYKAFTWEHKPIGKQLSVHRYEWNGNEEWEGIFGSWKNKNWSHMTEQTVTQGFSHKPTIQGLIETTGNLIINADNIENRYSIIKAGVNADIYTDKLTNLGVTAYKKIFMHCYANTDNCYAYNADGSRNRDLNIANGGVRHVSSEALDSVSGLVQAGGTLNLVVNEINNTAEEGSIRGNAYFEAMAVSGDPLGALSGLTAADALFTPNIDIGGATGALEGLPLPKPQSGGVGGTLPQQNFLYETRAKFLDVGKFYGSAYYLNRIGYNPDREIFFLGDAYFEKQLIEKQMRDLVGQGLGQGSFIPGSDAIEQVKNLLDQGADYAKAHNLPFGEALTQEQLDALETPMVVYVRQKVKGMDVYVPTLYIPEKDRGSFVSSGALIMGKDVNITSNNTRNSTLTNSGRIAASHQLHVHGGDLLGQGGHFAAGGDVVLLAEKSIHLEAGRTTVDGVETVLNSNALSAGGNASVIAKQDITAYGVRIATKGDLTMSTQQGNLTIGSAKTHLHINHGNATMHHQSEVSSGGSTTLSSGKNLNILGSDVQAQENMLLQAKDNVSIDATRSNMNKRSNYETSHVVLHNGAHVKAGKDMSVISGQDIHIAASDMEAKGNVSLDAQGEIAIGVRKDETESHFQVRNTKADRQTSTSLGSSITSGGDITALAGQDGKGHDLTITGSSVAAEGKVGLKASKDILITHAEDHTHYEMSYHKEGGAFSSSKSMHDKMEAGQVAASSLTGGNGVTLESGNDTKITGSIVIAGKEEETPDQAKAAISLHAGGDIVIKGAQEHYDQQQQSSTSGFLYEKSSKSSEAHTVAVSSVLGATGNIVMEADKNATITASHLLSGQDMSVTAENVTMDGMTDHHSSHAEEHKSGFGVGSGNGFVSIYGSEGKAQNEESFEHQGSSLRAKGNINITAKKKDITVVGSDISGENVRLSAARDVNVRVGQNSSSSSAKEERSGFGFQFEKNHSGASVGVGVASKKDKDAQKSTTSVQSHIVGNKDVQITADNDVNMQAADVLAGRDVNVEAGNNITLSESHDILNGKETHEKSFAGVTGSVNVGILGTVKDVTDAAKRFGHGDTKHKIGNGLIAGLKGYDLYNKGKGLYNGMKGGATKRDLLNMADASASITAGFKAEKAEASSQASTAVTGTIEGGHSVNMQAHKGSIHGVGVDIVAGSNPMQNNDAQSGNITLQAGQDITLESARNTQSTQNHSQNISVNVGYSYGSGDPRWMGNASFGKGKGSSEQVQQKNSHIVGTGAVHTTSGKNTTLEGGVVLGDRVKMEVGGDLAIASRSDTGQTSSKQKSVSVGFNGGRKDDAVSSHISVNKDKSSSDYHSVVEQSGIKAGEGGFEITVKDKTTLTGGIVESSASAEKNSLSTGSISTSDITNSAHAQASSKGLSISAGGPMYQGKYGVAKNIAKNVLDHATKQDTKEGYTKSAISEGTIVLTNEAGQRALTGEGVEQTIASLNRDTATAHQGVQQLDVAKLEQIVHENREMATQLLEEGFKYSDESYKTMFIKEHPLAVVDRDEKGQIIYLKDENGVPIRDARGQPIPQFHYLTDEEKKHLQEGSDGRVHVSFNGIFTPPEEAAVYAEQHAKDKNEPLYFVVFPQADSAISELLVAGYQKFLENNFWGLTNSTQEAKDLMYGYGNTGLKLYGHSRGGMTLYNALSSFKQEGVRGIADKTEVNFYAPAANALAAAGLLSYMKNGKQTSVGFDGHRYDFVSRVIGGNSYTYETVPTGSNRWKEWKKMFTDPNSVHTCLGDASPQCRYNYGSSHLEQFPLSKSWRKK
ncbi:hemagglutinin repeat-containing protein [Bartonella rattaustraliani]|uniref:hemagglutinin repeat-containing protein n=1 Tax=Bartonella rattaustraliani TaxID=481139 RepID=UPI0002DEC910|nr:hemagglutinin repeat-containing protein [Bartonella rattaustraliani]